VLIAPARPATAFGPAAQLFISYHREYCSQPFLVGDGALVDLANFIESAVSELDALARLRRGPCRSLAVLRRCQQR
jgi:hypothetical protein